MSLVINTKLIFLFQGDVRPPIARVYERRGKK